MKTPLLGLGTYKLQGKKGFDIIRHALEIGYEHIDTAHVYDNHKDVAEALVGFDRSKLFITSKIALDQFDPTNAKKSAEKACDQALKELKLDYLDLYLIHWPDHTQPMAKYYEALEELVHKKKIRKAGVSNFTIHHLDDLAREGLIPSANQVEFHPHLYQKALLDYCNAHHIQLISYRPLGGGKGLLEDPIFNKIGKNHKKTGAQVILRWLVQKEIPVIPKASSIPHLLENQEIFDFKLTEDEMHQLDGLHKNIRYCGAESAEFNY